MPASEIPVAKPDDLILITGAAGFIGPHVVDRLLGRGYRNLRCMVRPSSQLDRLLTVLRGHDVSPESVLFTGNLVSRDDALEAADGARVVLHMAAGRGQKSYADAVLNSVVTTRNLLDACIEHKILKRFVNVSSFSVYSSKKAARKRPLDEDCPLEEDPKSRGEAYCYAKVRQDQLVISYGTDHSLPYVIVRPGVVYGPGNEGISGRIGIGTFGLFLHFGGSNRIPLTYVENCAEAIALAGLKPGIDGEVFNVVDDELPTSRAFLRLYKRQVRRFPSLYFPKPLSYLLCAFWGWYARWSHNQLPPFLNRPMWRAYWRRTTFSNRKLKSQLGCAQIIPTKDGLKRHFEACRSRLRHA